MITISLKPNSKTPMYIQIYEYIKGEILNGNLSHPEKLPSSRSLASHLQVSRSTVDIAYEQLVAEGYVDAKEKRGYFVNPITHTQNFHVTSPADRPAEPVKIPETFPYDFDPDAVDTSHFPYSVWKSIGKNQLDNPENFISGSHYGNEELRQAISDYLHGSRGVNCSPEHIVVGAGLAHLLQMLCVLFEHGGVIAMEEPGYRSARQVLHSGGFEILDLPLKEDAFDTEALENTSANICYVTPSHQFPLGSVLSIARRQQLLAWASEAPDRYIIEDDHDSEFRYQGLPIPALQSLDHKHRVIYIGTFSKAISPAIRMGYMVLPETLAKAYRERCSFYPCPVPRLNQAVITDFIRQGSFEKHLNRMRKLYKGRHDRMVEAISRYLPEENFDITGDNAGLYLILRYHGPLDEKTIEKRAEKNGIRLRSLRDYYANPPADYLPSYLLGFAGMEDEAITEGIRHLAERVFLSPP
ncbi:MAG: PLP-dependent aminotransferase family protein [Lachnospiraceae bacterium]|nr:PLP-dependent aminotransferase family protein [Lachnospiraceae bacterium]